MNLDIKWLSQSEIISSGSLQLLKMFFRCKSDVSSTVMLEFIGTKCPIFVNRAIYTYIILYL